MSSISSFFLVGPTAVGKSSIGHRIARENDLDILSADSMLVYEGLNIGTAKPTQGERAGITYWGVDIASIDQSFSVASYHRYAIQSLRTMHERNRMALVVGGTGLYIKSLTHGLSCSKEPNPAVRAHLLDVLNKGGPQALQDMLKSDNAELYDELPDKNNPRRLIRALERTLTLNPTRPRDWQEIGSGPRIVGLTMAGDQLKKRIRHRVEAMYDSGMLEEVSQLLSVGLETAPTALQAIGYKEAIEHIKGNCSRNDAIARTATRTAQLAKKQFTWFRNQANVDWINIDLDDDMDTIIAKINATWKAHGPTPISE